METNNRMTCLALRCVKTMPAVFVLSALIGCDPCMNNPCNDGLACNGIETCTASGSTFECISGTPIQCAANEVCMEPDGVCEMTGCMTDADCDDGDACTTDACDPDTGDCTSTNITCPQGETCDPDTGMCASTGTGTGTPQTLLTASGTYTGSGACSDADDQVTLTDNNGTLTLSGFAGNADITFTLDSDTTATATGVTAFGVPGHTLRLMLDTQMGYIGFDLTVAGMCNTDLMMMTPQ